MGTRATYSIEKENSKYGIYIHWDGYEEGAASYFAEMLKLSNGRISPEFFLRANQGAQLTKPESHADTEYHYELSQDGHLKVKHRPYGGRWKFIGTTGLHMFLNKHNKYHNDEWTKEGSRFVSKGMLANEITQKEEELRNYKEKFPKHTGNISYIESDLQKLKIAYSVFKENNVVEFKRTK